MRYRLPPATLKKTTAPFETTDFARRAIKFLKKDEAWNFRTPPCIEGDKVLGTTAINRQLVVA